MSMSEFEREEDDGRGVTPLSRHGPELPADFSEEDEAFARELKALFSVEEEIVPPYFVQTLLEAEDPRFNAVEPGFEQKTRARVFRQLNLHHRLYERRPPLTSIVNALPARQTLLTLSVAALFFMVCTVLLTGQSFASGMDILLHGTHSGVMQMVHYPTGVHTDTQANIKSTSPGMRAEQSGPAQMTILQTEQLLEFPMYLPQYVPANYNLDSIYLYQSADQTWADGPVLELNYVYSVPGVTPAGTGKIAIREFLPNGNVFQVVERGAAYPLNVDHMGQAQAIYVDGQWVRTNRYSHSWIFGQRSELIYQRDGVVFWIVGDQRDGITKGVLMNIANSLQTLDFERGLHVTENIYSVTQLNRDSTGLFTGDIVAVSPNQDLSGMSIELAGPDQQQTKTTGKS
ncbi:MAG TPA: hypothetical protein VKV40_14905 [Ktedonobacteraceae bacterium]|nr:hypothetical protein [Ktedonobacteraceae bacterium]